jgi:hypothetical protein
MSAVGQTVGSWTLVAPADVPEPGSWYRAESNTDEGAVVAWARVLDAEDDIRALELAAERVKHLEHPAFPRPVLLDREARTAVFAAPAGVSLERVLEHRLEPAFVVTPSTLLDLALQLTEAIVRAHERGRPHGHLSPGQIWLTPEGRVVVWGIGPGPDAACEPAWCPPERARGRRASGDADQWAVAAIVAALAIGRVPWSGPDAAAQLEQASLGQLGHLIDPVTQQWRQLGLTITRALAGEPKDRWPSLHTLRQSFHAMSERVRAPSDLAAMGTELARRYGLPGLSVPTPEVAVRDGGAPSEEAPTQPGIAESADGGGPKRSRRESKRATVSASSTSRLIRSALEAVPEVEDASAHPTMVPDPSTWEFAGGLDAIGAETWDLPTDAGSNGKPVGEDGVRGLQAAEPSPAPALVWEGAPGDAVAESASQGGLAAERASEDAPRPLAESGLFAMPRRRSRGVLSAARADRVSSEPDATPASDEPAPPAEGAPPPVAAADIVVDEPAFSEEEPPTQVEKGDSQASSAAEPTPAVTDAPAPEVTPSWVSSPSEPVAAPSEAPEAPSPAPAFVEEEPPTQVGEVASPAVEAPGGAEAWSEDPPTRPGLVWSADAEALADAPPPPSARAASVVPDVAPDDAPARAALRATPARPLKAGRATGPRPVIAVPTPEGEPWSQADAPTQPDGPPIDLPVEPLDALPKVPDVWAGPAWDEEDASEAPAPTPPEGPEVTPAVAARTRLAAAVAEGPGSTVWEADDRPLSSARDGRAGPRPETIGVVFPTDPPGIDPRQIALWLGGAAVVTMFGWLLLG